MQWRSFSSASTFSPLRLDREYEANLPTIWSAVAHFSTFTYNLSMKFFKATHCWPEDGSPRAPGERV